MTQVNGVKVPFVPIVKENKGFPKAKAGNVQSTFDQLFSKELEKVKISGHAQKRLESRNIQLSTAEMNKIEEAVTRAEAKGAKDSLVMMDNTAFIVNVPNKTVVTAIDVRESKDNVFTNIDSVVFTK